MNGRYTFITQWWFTISLPRIPRKSDIGNRTKVSLHDTAWCTQLSKTLRHSYQGVWQWQIYANVNDNGVDSENNLSNQGYPAFTNFGLYKDIRNTCKRPYKHGFVSCFIPLIWQHITYCYSDSPLDTLLKHCKDQQQTERRGWCCTNDLHYCLLQQLSEYYATIMVAWAECCV